MLRYHAKSLQLVGVAPQEASDANSALATIEKRIGRPLPASLREWYSLADACSLMKRYSNCDDPIAVPELGANGLVAGEYLVFRHENQGVCSWAAWLNGSDDPPVLVDYDTEFEAPEPCANTFSEFLYTCCWDHALALKPPIYKALIQSQNAPISKNAISFLHRNFKPEIETNGWPGHTQYRFFSPDQRLLIWASKKTADWWLSADSEDALRRLLKSLWEIDDLGKSFWSHEPQGRSLLEQIRSQTP